ncbi:YybH family protein [Fulvivirga sedimenti]|uniref:Nuclear transport factor 2 family protein n=1 Tax=Fulvivirga sedimenti TaxID=2879465 RepID=A0A9X1HPU0_9BACT|nr:DUF4440 domain-containing protein [Fulvivirga sedimenti]MCA6073987.1 nuclear transport factor 2 family protein [Fulvivirga sedimenti]
MKRIMFYLLCGMLSFTSIVVSGQTNAPFDMTRAEKEIEKRLRDYEDALSEGDAVRLGNLYTADAEILHDGKPNTVGRENITKVFASMIEGGTTVSGFTTTGLWGNEEMLVEQGNGYFAPADGSWKSSGDYLLVWKKVDGEWKIFRDTWFSKEE